MNKLIKFLNGIIIPIILFVIATYLGDFKALDWYLAITVVVVCSICIYLCNSNDSLELEINNKDSDINKLKEKLTQMSIYSNGNSPYIIQLVINEDVIQTDTWYNIEIIVSTIEKKYDISYINISFNPDIEVDRCDISTIDNSYNLINIMGQKRSGVNEYNLKIKDNLLEKTTAKAIFKVKFKQQGINNLNIEVVGVYPLVKRVENKELNVINS